MTDITLPYWLFVILASAPVLCLLTVVVKVIKNMRKETGAEIDHPITSMALQPMDSPNFQNDLNTLQIDTVFNTLSALVETERIKLKSLLCPTMSQVSAPLVDSSHVDQGLCQQVANKTKGISQQIAERAAAGESTGEIASSLGISCNEVELSISLSEAIIEERPARLEAVA